MRVMYFRLFGMLLGLAVLAACGSDLSEIDELRAEPAAQLTYPGSQELRQGGRETQRTIEGLQPAFAWRLLGTEATIDELFEWHAAELEADGWVVGGGSSRIQATGELRANAWEREGLIVRLGVEDPARTDPELQGEWAYLYSLDIIKDRDSYANDE